MPEHDCEDISAANSSGFGSIGKWRTYRYPLDAQRTPDIFPIKYNVQHANVFLRRSRVSMSWPFDRITDAGYVSIRLWSPTVGSSDPWPSDEKPWKSSHTSGPGKPVCSRLDSEVSEVCRVGNPKYTPEMKIPRDSDSANYPLAQSYSLSKFNLPLGTYRTVNATFK